MSWHSPLFGFETMRQSRKAWTHWVRLVYCSMLLQFLYFVLGDDRKNTIGRIAGSMCWPRCLVNGMS